MPTQRLTHEDIADIMVGLTILYILASLIYGRRLIRRTARIHMMFNEAGLVAIEEVIRRAATRAADEDPHPHNGPSANGTLTVAILSRQSRNTDS